MNLVANISLVTTPGSGVMFADIGGFLFFILFVVGSIFVQWLQNRGKKDDWSEQEMPRQPGTRPPVSKPHKMSDWEEELRRMLENEVPTSPRPTAPPVIPPLAPRTPVPPPPPVHKTPPLVPQPVPSPTMSVPKVFNQPRIYKGHCENCDGHIEFPANMLGDSIVCPHCMKYTVLQPFIPTRVDELQHKTELSSFKESSAAYQRAASLEQNVAAHMQAITSRPVEATKATGGKPRALEIQQVVSLLRKPQTARQAIIASVILGQPKGLEI